MKKALIILTLLLLTQDAWAINKFKRAGAHNWTDDAGWSTTSGGANDTTAPTATDDVFLDANSGNVTISATSVGKSLDCTGYTGTLTQSAQLTLSGSATFVAGMTYTASSASANFRIANGTFVSAGKLMWIVSSVTSGTLTLGDNLSFVAQKTGRLIAVMPINLAGFTVSGNSATNRIIVDSGTLGTASGTVTLNGGTFANADFRDITLSASTDLSAITGLSGDCGGNTNITFTTAATQTYTGGTGSWSDVTKWTSRVPLPQDDVLMSGVTGGTITADMPRLGKSIDWTGASGTPAWSQSVAWTIYGSITYISAMTTSGAAAGQNFEGRGSFTITTAGQTQRGPIIAAFGGTYDLQDAMTILAGNAFTLSNGTFNTNGFTINATSQLSISGTGVRAFNCTNSTINISASSGTAWSSATTTSLTFTSTGSTIVISDTGASSKTFAGGGLTYNNLLISGGGAGAVIITGANTFNRIYTNGGGTKSITLPGSTTTTIISNQGLGNLTNLITFTASAGSATIANAQGNLSWDYVSLTNIVGSTSGNGKFYAGPTTHSTDGGGNTNWIFDLAPAGVSGAGRQGRFIGYPGVYRR